ncbi:MAG: hypothetical protein WAV23_01150 [Minisyncoccia bacterium]
MQIVLILFFVSLAGIALMIGRKLIIPKDELVEPLNDFFFEIPDSKDVRIIAVKNLKRYGFIALVITIRLYVRTLNLIKDKGNKLYNKAHKIITRNKFEKSNGHKEVSKFLRKVSEYKQKISKIKHQIVEEEKNQS